VSWHLNKASKIYSDGRVDDIYKISKSVDTYNRAMYLVDNYGQRYDHIAANDAARGGDMEWGMTLNGGFIYDKPVNGANTFTFYDDDNGHVSITFTVP
jgi:hypothetical protein